VPLALFYYFIITMFICYINYFLVLDNNSCVCNHFVQYDEISQTQGKKILFENIFCTGRQNARVLLFTIIANYFPVFSGYRWLICIFSCLFTAKELKVCGSVRSGGEVCCSADMELRLQARARDQHEKTTKDTLLRLQTLLTTRGARFHSE